MSAPAVAATVKIAIDRPLGAFRPDRALGGALDGHSLGETAQIYAPANVRAMTSAGLGSVTYRLRTELGVEAWHPTPAGTWSDPGRHEGYWTAAARRTNVLATYGYGLPRRGNSIDQANDTGYSRIDDGSERTFWKSNPYLDPHFTREPHPQWVMVYLGRPRRVDALQVDWYQPYATRFRVQYFTGRSAVYLADGPPGRWVDFPTGTFRGHGGRQLLRLAAKPLDVAFVRLLMSAGSHTGAPGSRDIRDRLGYAIRELRLGTLVAAGGGGGYRLDDLIHHAPAGENAPPGAAQTTIYASSTDPWHRASDRDTNYEQPSFQTVLRSGLAHHRPILLPVPLLYSTPEAAVAELSYLRQLHVPIRGVELGEEPDGQLMQPEDYGALYVQFARAIHRVFPGLALGGPVFQTSIPDWLAWPNAHGDRSWTHRLLQYLREHHALSELAFFAFEWYPFDQGCAPPAPQLAQAAGMLRSVLAQQHAHGVPAALPIYITEYGYSAFAAQDEVDLPGALLNADTVGTFLAHGGTAAYLYGYEPDILIQELPQCATWGNLILFQSNDQHRIRYPVAAYWETRMLTHDWVTPGDGVHTVYPSSSTARDAAGNELVRAYALRRPNGSLGVLLLNVDPQHPYAVDLQTTRAGVAKPLEGRLIEAQLSRLDYVWRSAGDHGRPITDKPPLRRVLPPGSTVRLPPYSVTVVQIRGRG
jgi:hypothetical protein